MRSRQARGGVVLGCATGAFLALSCGTTDHESACSVDQNDDGSATITCEDGTSATVAPGQDGSTGEPGPPGASGDEGDEGMPGAVGDAGVPGADGSSCTIVDQGGGAQVLSCSDGSSTVIRPGGTLGLGGAGGEPQSGSIFYGASSFVTTSAIQDPISISAAGDFAFIGEGTSPYYNYLLAPVQLPQGAEVYSMRCFYFDNTSQGDLTADAAFYVRRFESESGVEGVTTPMTTTDFAATEIQMVEASPPTELVIDNDANTYFIRIYWFTGDSVSSAVRFYGCALDYGTPGI